MPESYRSFASLGMAHLRLVCHLSEAKDLYIAVMNDL